MKATGIVRRIDDLGRVVIPKEIRRTMRIREGDPMEIFISDEGDIVFSKYSSVGGLESAAGNCAEVLGKLSGRAAVVCDRDRVVAASGPAKREWAGRPITPALERIMEARKVYIIDSGEPVSPFEGSPQRVRVAAPIMAAGDILGCVAILTEEGEQRPDPSDAKLAAAAAGFLGRTTEI